MTKKRDKYGEHKHCKNVRPMHCHANICKVSNRTSTDKPILCSGPVYLVFSSASAKKIETQQHAFNYKYTHIHMYGISYRLTYSLKISFSADQIKKQTFNSISKQ